MCSLFVTKRSFSISFESSFVRSVLCLLLISLYSRLISSNAKAKFEISATAFSTSLVCFFFFFTKLPSFIKSSRDTLTMNSLCALVAFSKSTAEVSFFCALVFTDCVNNDHRCAMTSSLAYCSQFRKAKSIAVRERRMAPFASDSKSIPLDFLFCKADTFVRFRRLIFCQTRDSADLARRNRNKKLKIVPYLSRAKSVTSNPTGQARS
mmetsp:Transcript_11168/g.31591  ORF Transcript_11168/g.31591 Transcript_11168/m.31591 type:complete len:208 (+) Transcript_11168:1814-2437(+)